MLNVLNQPPYVWIQAVFFFVFFFCLFLFRFTSLHSGWLSWRVVRLCEHQHPGLHCPRAISRDSQTPDDIVYPEPETSWYSDYCGLDLVCCLHPTSAVRLGRIHSWRLHDVLLLWLSDPEPLQRVLCVDHVLLWVRGPGVCDRSVLCWDCPLCKSTCQRDSHAKDFQLQWRCPGHHLEESQTPGNGHNKDFGSGCFAVCPVVVPVRCGVTVWYPGIPENHHPLRGRHSCSGG